jgi:tetratricopeptide (TPR) repeat protein
LFRFEKDCAPRNAMPKEAAAKVLPELEIGKFAPIDEWKLPPNSKQLEAAQIVNFESRRQNKRIEKFTKAIQLDAKSGAGWFNRGRAFFEAGQYDRAIDDFNEAINLDPNNPQFSNARGIAYYYEGRHDDAVDQFEKIFDRFANLSDFQSSEQFIRILLNRCSILQRVGHHERAVAGYDNIYKQFGNATEPAIRECVALALLCKAGSLDDEGAIAAYDDLLEKFGRAPEVSIREAVATGLLHKGDTLATFVPQLKEEDYLSPFLEDDLDSAKELAEKNDAAIIAYDVLIELFGQAVEGPIRDRVIAGLINKSFVLDTLGRHDEAIVAYSGMLARFGADIEPTHHTTRLLSNRSTILSWFGRRELSVGRFHEGCKYLKEAISLHGRHKSRAKIEIEKYLLTYYGLSPTEEKNPSNGYRLPKCVITEAELRKYISEQSALLTERLSKPGEQPFPILNERTVKAIIAHGRKHPWDDRREQGWPYHTNAFVFMHITYRKWVNRGLTREILAWADPSLYAHLRTKISREGLPEWLDVPSGPEARARAIIDPAERAELEITRRVLRDRTRKHRASIGD